MKEKYVKKIDNSKDAYAKLKPITDAAQAGTLSPWGKPVMDLLAEYKVSVDRLKDLKAQVNLSFPTSITAHRSMAIGFRYQKDEGGFTEDLFVFEEGVGLTCYYRGAQEQYMPEYAGTHHAEVVLREFLPDVQQELESMRQKIDGMSVKGHLAGVEIVTDAEFEQEIKQIADDFKAEVESFARAHGNSSAVQIFSMAVQKEATKKRRAIMTKRAASERRYELERQDIADEYKDKYSKKQGEINERGMFHSGLGQQELSKVKEQEARAIQKLNLLFGKPS